MPCESIRGNRSDYRVLQTRPANRFAGIGPIIDFSRNAMRMNRFAGSRPIIEFSRNALRLDSRESGRVSVSRIFPCESLRGNRSDDRCLENSPVNRLAGSSPIIDVCNIALRIVSWESVRWSMSRNLPCESLCGHWSDHPLREDSPADRFAGNGLSIAVTF